MTPRTPGSSLNKSALHREQARLRRFRRILPSLDLKRRQLIAERSRERTALADTEKDMEELTRQVRRELPMAGMMTACPWKVWSR
ncbi:MAG: hypothetical protein U5L11_01630 [Arhodomonas sp.]|nr:hypothetical protein [Arhodomonas sp.]